MTGAAAAPPLAPEDEAAIRVIVAGLETYWNAADGDGYSGHFAEDADFVVINGRRMAGRTTIAFGHQQLSETIYRGSHNCARGGERAADPH